MMANSNDFSQYFHKTQTRKNLAIFPILLSSHQTGKFRPGPGRYKWAQVLLVLVVRRAGLCWGVPMEGRGDGGEGWTRLRGLRKAARPGGA